MKKRLLLLLFEFIFLFANAQTILPPDSLLLTSPVGFKYIKHSENKGEKPQPGQVVLYHAKMRNGATVHLDTRTFAETPALEIPTAQSAKEWALPDIQVLLHLAKGDSATTFLRIDTLKTKPKGFANSDWIAYDIVCVDILDKADWEKGQPSEMLDFTAIQSEMDRLILAYKKKDTRKQMALERTASGIQYMILEEGSGNFPTSGRRVAVHYAAYLRHGTLVDNSIEANEPLWFTIGQGMVIEGWDEGIALLREGATAVFFIPSRLAYGEKGALPAVPPYSEMIYFIKLLKVE